jgi:predicted transcriptional regulator
MSFDQTTAPWLPFPNGQTDEEWAQILDCSPAEARRALNNLIARGLIEEDNGNAE